LHVPAVTAEQMREVDRIMVEDLHIELVQMMENAGRNLAQLTISAFAPTTATVLAGPGGNGGGGLVAARHLANRGVEVRVVLAQPAERMAPVPAHQLDILRRMTVKTGADPAPADVTVDALLGYSIQGDPRGRAAELIEWVNAQPAPVLALDSPSGLDVTTGRAGTPCVRAAATMTLALPKTGLRRGASEVGRLYVADISVPPVVYQRLGLDVPDLFRDDTIVALDGGTT
jgi:NAD(P)H-hydrate epimerase